VANSSRVRSPRNRSFLSNGLPEGSQDFVVQTLSAALKKVPTYPRQKPAGESASHTAGSIVTVEWPLGIVFDCSAAAAVTSGIAVQSCATTEFGIGSPATCSGMIPAGLRSSQVLQKGDLREPEGPLNGAFESAPHHPADSGNNSPEQNYALWFRRRRKVRHPVRSEELLDRPAFRTDHK
jgi:hypothetical protein